MGRGRSVCGLNDTGYQGTDRDRTLHTCISMHLDRYLLLDTPPALHPPAFAWTVSVPPSLSRNPIKRLQPTNHPECRPSPSPRPRRPWVASRVRYLTSLTRKIQQRTNAADAQPATSLFASSIHPSPLACRLKEQVSSSSSTLSLSLSLFSLKADSSVDVACPSL